MQGSRSFPALIPPSWEQDPKKNDVPLCEKKSLPTFLSRCEKELKFCELERPRLGIHLGAKGDIPRAFDLKAEGDSLRLSDPEFPRNIKILEEGVIAIKLLGYVNSDIPGVCSIYSEGDKEFIAPTTVPLIKRVPPTTTTTKTTTKHKERKKKGLKRLLIHCLVKPFLACAGH